MYWIPVRSKSIVLRGRVHPHVQPRDRTTRRAYPEAGTRASAAQTRVNSLAKLAPLGFMLRLWGLPKETTDMSVDFSVVHSLCWRNQRAITFNIWELPCHLLPVHLFEVF